VREPPLSPPGRAGFRAAAGEAHGERIGVPEVSGQPGHLRVDIEPGTLTTVPIRQDDEYHGLRLAAACMQHLEQAARVHLAHAGDIRSRSRIRIRALPAGIANRVGSLLPDSGRGYRE
jgi:GNAT superfamily N-acetyltransferase